ncbi:hypothetical protein ACJJTC_010835 [Scirpophaga incertulas]
MDGLSWDIRVPNLLLGLRATPCTVTNKSPAELMMNRRLRTLLDTLHPNNLDNKRLENEIRNNSQQNHRETNIGQKIMYRNYSMGGPKWLAGTVLGKCGPSNYKIETESGVIIKRHIDQLIKITPSSTQEKDDRSFPLYLPDTVTADAHTEGNTNRDETDNIENSQDQDIIIEIPDTEKWADMLGIPVPTNSTDGTILSKQSIFFKNIPLIASVMRPFIVSLDKELIKKLLPMAFRHKYHKVSCIIDCLEIDVQKPSKAIKQVLSWSDYKKANTIKYLISCTSNGLINYISNGYGGRITDTCIVETSDFSKCLQPNMCVMADRGFKHVEVYLRKMGVLLVRPPSVVSGAKLTKTEAKETKQIASLRIHVKRVIRRLREFNMLKPHACLNLRLVKVLDDVITIACGLINIQDSLIK